ncbi:MAG: extracellular solute-binding protein [Desulfobacteraceae bacterium]|nr:extracellular solute-binding protein [Desulfobacteraceae bacterium]
MIAILIGCTVSIGNLSAADNKLRVFTWDGYVIAREVAAVNKLLKYKGYDYNIEVIQPWAEGPEQMFDVLKCGRADISFLTLNYIKMQGNRTAKLLQPININSPRLTNYKFLLKSLTNIAMGMDKDKHLYVPFGGGAYGIWINRKKVKITDVPISINELWAPKWKGRLSLTKGQVQPNLALSLLAIGKPPFYLNDLAGNKKVLIREGAPNGKLQKKTTALYAQVGKFWENEPEFSDQFLLVASYGISAAAENARGGKWKLINFKEGNTVWLDTINFHKDLTGRKLEAAEIFLNYFIGKKVQDRVVKHLGMVAASTLMKHNVLLDADPNFFKENMFWPPYDSKADNLMRIISDRAMKARDN